MSISAISSQDTNVNSSLASSTSKKPTEQNVAFAKEMEEANSSSEATNATSSLASGTNKEPIDKNVAFLEEMIAGAAPYGTFPSDHTFMTEGDPYEAMGGLTFEAPNGESFYLALNGDAKITQNDDGSSSIYFADSHKTLTYNIDGSITEERGNTLDPNATTLSINYTEQGVTIHSDDTLLYEFPLAGGQPTYDFHDHPNIVNSFLANAPRLARTDNEDEIIELLSGTDDEASSSEDDTTGTVNTTDSIDTTGTVGTAHATKATSEDEWKNAIHQMSTTASMIRSIDTDNREPKSTSFSDILQIVNMQIPTAQKSTEAQAGA